MSKAKQKNLRSLSSLTPEELQKTVDEQQSREGRARVLKEANEHPYAETAAGKARAKANK